MITIERIIQDFEVYVDDGTELSLIDEIGLLNKAYNLVWEYNLWEFSKKGFDEVVSGNEINLPDDFGYILLTDVSGEQKKVVWVDNDYHEVVNFSERRAYQDKDGYCWVEIGRNKLVFSKRKKIGGRVSYDYKFVPEALTMTSGLQFPDRFYPVLYHLMASDDYMIQQFDKARSYADENRAKAEEWLERMKIWNANLIT